MITKIHIGSTNPAKVKAVSNVFQKANVYPMKVPSEVADQPLSDRETRLGAINRAKYLVEKENALFAIGLEGGVVEEEDGMMLCNWGALATSDGKIYTAGGARILLPENLANAVRSGKELGDVIDQWAHRSDVRKNEGTIGILTNGLVTRHQMFQHIVTLLYGQWQYFEGKK